MYMKNKASIRTVCPIIALLLFVAATTPAAVQAREDEKIQRASALYMLKLAIAAKNGNPALSEEERLVVKEEVLILMENLFKKIERSGISDETMSKYDRILPQYLKGKLMLVSDIAKADIATEAKVNALVNAFDIGCDSLSYGAALVFVLSILFGINFGAFGAIMYLAAVLCYLGVL